MLANHPHITASSWVLGHLMSACFAGILSDYIGRKKSLLIDTAVFFLGFILLSASQSTECLVVARFILGYPLVSQVWFYIQLRVVGAVSICTFVRPWEAYLKLCMYEITSFQVYLCEILCYIFACVLV